MTKPKEKRVNIDRSKVTSTKPKTRDLVECNCTLHCHGSKMIDPRTFKIHQREMAQFQTIVSDAQSSSRSRRTNKKLDDAASSSTFEREIEPVEQNQNSSDESSDESFDNSEEIQPDQEPIDVPKKRKRYNKFRDPIPVQEHELEPSPIERDFDSDSTASENDYGSEDREFEEYVFNEDDSPVEQFTAPDFDDCDESDHEYPDVNVNFNDFWILLWIFKFQSRFRIPDVAIDSIIKFFRTVLLDTNKSRFEGFPTSSYKARKLLGIGKQEKTYAVCPDCNTLHKISDILPQNANDQSDTGFKCTHVEFPNHSRKAQRKPCGTEITKRVPVTNGYVYRLKMVFPLPSLKVQLITMYQRSGLNRF